MNQKNRSLLLNRVCKSQPMLPTYPSPSLHTSLSSFLPLNRLSRLPLSPSPSIYTCETPSKYLFNAKMTSHGCQITTCSASLRVESVPKKCVHYYFPPNPKAGGEKGGAMSLSSFSLWEFSSRDLGLLTLA